MNRLELIWRGLQWRRVSSLVNVASIAIGVALVCAVLAMQHEVRARFEGPARGYGLVVGAPGSALQLVLNAVFHLEESSGNVPLALLDELDASRSTALVVPYAVGDSFRGFRVVATSEAFFDPRFPYPAADRAEDKLRAGRLPSFGDAERREVVVGASVADSVGLRVGDRIEFAHGVEEHGMAHEHETMWEVVGLLAPTGTAIDGVVVIDLDAFFAMEDHDHVEPGLSALLVFPRRGVHTAVLMGALRGRTDLQVADVGDEVRRLLQMTGRADAILMLVSWMVVVVAMLSVFGASYASTRARRPELAVLRAMGMRRRSVVALVVAETSALASVGAVLGCLIAHLALYAAADALERALGFHPDPMRLTGLEGAVVLMVIVAGALAGWLPGMQTYRSDVVASLREAS